MVVMPAALDRINADQAIADVSRKLIAKTLDSRDMLVRRDYGFGLAVSDHACNGGIRDRNIEWDRNETTTDDSEHRLSHLVAVLHEHNDAIAVSEPEPVQRICHL